MSATRLAVGWAAVLGTLPYLALKVAWLTGSTVGVRDVAAFDDPGVFVANAVTAGMEVVAIVVALAFTYSWWRRVPGFFVLVPAWVGTGFLAPVAIMFPFMDFGAPQAFLDPWVPVMVYGGFALQGVMLAAAFVFYARERWPSVFRLDTADVPAAGPVRTVFAHVGALLAAATGVRSLMSGTLPDVILGVLALGAAAGTVVMTNRVRVRLLAPVAVTWLGAGTLFAWGFWGALNTIGATFLSGGEPAWPSVLGFAAGLLIGVTSLVLLSGCGDRRPYTAGFAARLRTHGGT